MLFFRPVGFGGLWGTLGDFPDSHFIIITHRFAIPTVQGHHRLGISEVLEA